VSSLALRIALAALSRPRRHRYGGDRSQVADLHLPAGDGPFGVVVLLHGGYWQTRYGKLVMRPLAADLTRRGFAAWNVEYRRLGTGRGGGGGWPETFDDVAAAVDALAELGEPRLDLERVSLAGHSAGGQLALWAAARPELPAGAPGSGPRVRAARVAALAPVTNLAAAGAVARTLMGGGPEQVPDRYAQADPLRRAPLAVPALVVHPADDATVPVRRSREYVAAARARGGDVAFVEPPTGGHRAPIDPATDAWRAVADWLEATGGMTALTSATASEYC
jgi:acetyl esterase/lipase